MENKLPKRSEVPVEMTWRLTDIYETEESLSILHFLLYNSFSSLEKLKNNVRKKRNSKSVSSSKISLIVAEPLYFSSKKEIKCSGAP